jgi:hypothetical protein
MQIEQRHAAPRIGAHGIYKCRFQALFRAAVGSSSKEISSGCSASLWFS